MNAMGGELAFTNYIRDTNFSAQVDRIERRLIGLTNTAVRETAKMDDTFKKFGQLAAGYFSFNALAQLPMQLIRVRGEVQQLEIAFTTMLRDKGKADQLISEAVALTV